VSESALELPVFPLKTVIFPQGVLPLRIFEPRYMDMVGQCMREEMGFAVCLLSHGGEAGAPAGFCAVGTECVIADWDALPNGLLGITAQGRRKLRVERHEIHNGGLIVGSARVLDAEPEVPMPGALRPLCDLLGRLLDELGSPYSDLPRDYEDAGWVGGRLVELLPLELREKQALLEMSDPCRRLDLLWDRITATPSGPQAPQHEP